MIGRTKQLLKAQSGAVKLFDLVEAMLRLKIDDGLQSMVRQMIMEGNFSRDAYDIAISLHYFGREYDLHQRPADRQVLLKLLKDLRYMVIGDLRSNHLIYLVKGIESCARGLA